MSRSIDSLREEIQDLTAYLEGVPREVRRGGAFAGFEARLERLRAEFIVERLQALLESNVPLPEPTEISQMPVPALAEWARELSNAVSRAEHRQRRDAEAHHRLERRLATGGVLTGVSAALAAALAAPLLGTLLASGAALLAATTLVIDPSRRIRRDQVTADQLENVKRVLTELRFEAAATEVEPPTTPGGRLLASLASVLENGDTGSGSPRRPPVEISTDTLRDAAPAP